MATPAVASLPDEIVLTRWFLTPMPQDESDQRGPVRVWGVAPDGRLWRSSSVAQAVEPRRLVTRHGTTVFLNGRLDAEAAAAVGMARTVVDAFVDGLPKRWRHVWGEQDGGERKRRKVSFGGGVGARGVKATSGRPPPIPAGNKRHATLRRRSNGLVEVRKVHDLQEQIVDLNEEVEVVEELEVVEEVKVVRKGRLRPRTRQGAASVKSDGGLVIAKEPVKRRSGRRRSSPSGPFAFVGVHVPARSRDSNRPSKRKREHSNAPSSDSTEIYGRRRSARAAAAVAAKSERSLTFSEQIADAAKKAGATRKEASRTDPAVASADQICESFKPVLGQGKRPLWRNASSDQSRVTNPTHSAVGTRGQRVKASAGSDSGPEGSGRNTASEKATALPKKSGRTRSHITATAPSNDSAGDAKSVGVSDVKLDGERDLSQSENETISDDLSVEPALPFSNGSEMVSRRANVRKRGRPIRKPAPTADIDWNGSGMGSGLADVRKMGRPIRKAAPTADIVVNGSGMGSGLANVGKRGRPIRKAAPTADVGVSSDTSAAGASGSGLLNGEKGSSGQNDGDLMKSAEMTEKKARDKNGKVVAKRVTGLRNSSIASSHDGLSLEDAVPGRPSRGGSAAGSGTSVKPVGGKAVLVSTGQKSSVSDLADDADKSFAGRLSVMGRSKAPADSHAGKNASNQEKGLPKKRITRSSRSSKPTEVGIVSEERVDVPGQKNVRPLKRGRSAGRSAKVVEVAASSGTRSEVDAVETEKAVPKRRTKKARRAVKSAETVATVEQIGPIAEEAGTSKRVRRPRRAAAIASKPVMIDEQSGNSDDEEERPSLLKKPSAVAFALDGASHGSDEVKRRSPEVAPLTVGIPSKSKLGRRKAAVVMKEAEGDPFGEGDSDDCQFPGTPMLKRAWTEDQLSAFAAQRTAVPAGIEGYWERVAAGVEGKSRKECMELWDSNWKSPTKVTRKTAAKPKMTTPELAAKLVSAAPGAKKTARFAADVRRVAEAMNRDVDDEMLEPPLMGVNSVSDTGKASALTPGGGKDSLMAALNNSSTPVALLRGTPDTGAKSKRAEAERMASAETPEILSRGRSFGLPQADKYRAAFHRRRKNVKTGPPLTKKKGQVPGATGQPSKAGGSQEPVDDVDETEARALADCEDDDDDEASGDLFF